MKTLRYCFHKFCAWPAVFVWALGAFIIWTPLMVCFAQAGVIELLLTDWTAVVLLLICLTAILPWGYLIAVIVLGRSVVWACERCNGAPHKVGDRVMILLGPHSGAVTCIQKKVVGQGGLVLSTVDLGADVKAQSRDLIPDYALLRLPSSHL